MTGLQYNPNGVWIITLVNALTNGSAVKHRAAITVLIEILGIIR
jgi:hypothetical protein